MRELIIKNGARFPLSVHDGKLAIWHLTTALTWFRDEKGRKLNGLLLEVSRVAMRCNLVKESAGLDPKISIVYDSSWLRTGLADPMV